jgi:2-methylcitrate dehydratase
LKAEPPTLLRNSALKFYSIQESKAEGVRAAKLFGSKKYTTIEKAIAANVSATHELNSNGFSLGYSFDAPERVSAGEIDHNSFYPVVIAASHINSQIDGKKALKAMILLDEIRGRLDESINLLKYKLDHALFGGIASTVVYGALLNASAKQIEHAIGLLISNYTPWRAVRGGTYDLSNSASSSSAFTTEMGIMCMNRVMDGLTGPSLELPPNDINVTNKGKNFSVMGMHFRFGCYAALSSGAIYSLVNVLLENPQIFEDYGLEDIVSIRIRTFTRAYEMLGMHPRSDTPISRQAACYSIPYLIARMLSKKKNLRYDTNRTFQDFYNKLSLGPLDFTKKALLDNDTCTLMDKIDVIDGGELYNKHYPEGLPTNLGIYFKDGTRFSSGMTKFP